MCVRDLRISGHYSLYSLIINDNGYDKEGPFLAYPLLIIDFIYLTGFLMYTSKMF